MTDEGARLDRFLAETLAWMRSENTMPELGGKSFAVDMLAKAKAAKQRIAELKVRGAGAITEFVTEADLAEKGIKNIEGETLELRQLNNELHGNQPPVDDKKPDGAT